MYSIPLLCDSIRFAHMVAIAQSVEHLIVVQKVARSSRVSHPTFSAGFSRFFFMLDYFFTLSIILFAIRFFNLSVHVYARILVHVGVE